MKNKIFYSIILFFLITFLSITYCFADDHMQNMEEMKNDVRDVIGGAEYTIENAANDVVKGSKDITNGIENTGENIKNNMQNSTNYSTQRTSTATTDATFLGMNSTTWIWLILALAAIGIIAIVYNFSKENNNDYDHIIND